MATSRAGTQGTTLSRRSVLSGAAAVVAVALVPKRGEGRIITVEGARGDGRTNDLEPLRKAIEEARSRGHGRVQIPPGTFLLRPDAGDLTALAPAAGTIIQGAGREKTRLLMADGAEGHVINAREGGVAILDLTVDGGRRTSSNIGGHNVRLEGDNLLVERVRSVNSASYGIGLGQRRYVRNCILRDVEIVDAGVDGVDLKNKLGRTEATFENLIVRGFNSANRKVGQAGVDLRGKVTVRNLLIDGVPHGGDGLRFRHGEEGVANGPGAHGSTATNVVITGNGEHGTGIAVLARDVTVSQVRVSGLTFALRIGAARFKASDGALSGSNYILGGFSRDWPIDNGQFERVQFKGRIAAKDLRLPDFKFDRCEFTNCAEVNPRRISGAAFSNCVFAPDCDR
ncbi:MAG: hypothetical protein KIS73_13695 [Enhydrobacter sp.]|nr:hypothetical protein [Enhydrobacter sp.]